MLSHPQLCIFGAQPAGGHCHLPIRTQSFAALSHMKPPGLNRHTCPSKPNVMTGLSKAGVCKNASGHFYLSMSVSELMCAFPLYSCCVLFVCLFVCFR